MLGIVTGLTSEAKILSGLDVVCVCTGGRADVARVKIDALMAKGASGLVSFGIAGALSPGLVVGDLIIADTVVTEEGERWPTHGPWFDALLAEVAPLRKRASDVPHHAASRRSEGHSGPLPGWSVEDDLSHSPGLAAGTIEPADERSDDGSWRKGETTVGIGRGSNGSAAPRDPSMPLTGTGAILGHDQILSTVEQKIAAHRATGALTVDMESHHVARAAAERGLPFLAVRAVSDRAGEVLPAVTAGFVDADGQTKMSAVLRALISRRVSVRELLAIGRASRRAHQSLFRCRGALAGLR